MLPAPTGTVMRLEDLLKFLMNWLKGKFSNLIPALFSRIYWSIKAYFLTYFKIMFIDILTEGEFFHLELSS